MVLSGFKIIRITGDDILECSFNLRLIYAADRSVKVSLHGGPSIQPKQAAAKVDTSNSWVVGFAANYTALMPQVNINSSGSIKQEIYMSSKMELEMRIYENDFNR